MNVHRAPENPIIIPEQLEPSRPGYSVVCVLNAGAAEVDGEVLLLLRVAEQPPQERQNVFLCPIYDDIAREIVLRPFERNSPGWDFSDSRLIRGPEGIFLTSISHLRIARSRDGIRFEIDPEPALFPETAYEAYGIEDPRITRIGDAWYIQYVAVSRLGIVTALAETADFRSFRRLGVIFPPDNKDVTIFPGRSGGRYLALHRPISAFAGRPEIWYAESPDLVSWGNHRWVMGVRDGAWDSLRIGASAVPFRVAEGWLEIYHGADHANRYCLGAVLLDPDRPWEVKARSGRPILEPEKEYERNGFFGEVVFSCGALCRDDTVRIYYGAADTSIACADLSLREILAGLG